MIVPAYWYVSSNFGDNLTPYLIHKAGKIPCYVGIDSPTPKMLGVGSILALANGSTTVWGSGLGQEGQPVFPGAQFLAVRGPLSAFRIRSCGGKCPDVFGDPGLLLPRLYSPTGERKCIGLIPHFLDQERVFRVYANCDLKLINLIAPIEQVVDEVNECSAIVSSSLHGLVLAAAYDIPLVWVKFSDAIEGGDFKFWDFFLSLGVTPPRCLDLRDPELPRMEDIAKKARSVKVPNMDALWQSCPFL